ncbi:MAG: glucose-1-phosphate adenylyltransferase, partial [Gammaproteobacteria bacterium]|nr:glucose-1-phosphate adenylyltransferase [Gammaproteobacteria bacterium]
IAGGSVQHSILFPNVYIGDEAEVHDSIIFNSVRIGDGARIRRCIIDKHVEVPNDERIGFDIEKDRQRFTVSDDGVVVVPRGYRFS